MTLAVPQRLGIIGLLIPRGSVPLAPRGYDPGGFPFWGFVNVIVAFVVDGFDLYHSIKMLGRSLALRITDTR